MAQPVVHNRPNIAIALKLVAVCLFMIMAAVIKVAVQSVPPGQAVFFRSLFAIPVILLWIWQQGALREALIPNNLRGHIWRGLFGTTAMGLTFAGLGLLPLPEVTAIGYATPIFTVILAVFMLNERVGLYRMSAVALGLIGVLVVIWPRLTLDAAALTQGTALGAILVLIASILRALVQIHIRTLVKTEHTAAIVFYFSATATIMSLFSIPFGWVVPDPLTLGLMIGAGLIGGVAQILVTASYRYGAASMLAPFDYSSLIFAGLIGWLVFSEIPTWSMIVGAGLVVAGGAVIMWRERQLGLTQSKAPAVTDPKG